MEGVSLRVRLDGFEGQLSELLAAVDSGSIAAADVRLGALLEQVRSAPFDAEGAVGAFVSLAQLIERKARALLPVPPPEDDPLEPSTPEEEERALAERLAAYDAFAEAAAALRVFEQRRAGRLGRPEAAAAADPRVAAASAAPAQPAPDVDLERLLRVFAEVWERARPRTREVRRERWSVALAVRDLRHLLARAGSADFADLFDPDSSRLQVVVTFLAILEMVRQGEVAVHQDGPFAPLRVEWRRPRREEAPDVR